MTDLPFDLDLLRRYDVAGPRYTSYPTAQQFGEFGGDDHVKAVMRSNRLTPDAPVSLYVHAPFCASPCYYCGCTRVITRDAGRMTDYLQVLMREIGMQGALLGGGRVVEQLHLGGGTPTYFADDQLRAVLARIERAFGFAAPDRREFSIEIDPRTVDAERLQRLAQMGFNRVSLGVQDFDPEVQAAVRRPQPPELVEALVDQARWLRLRSVSFDLIYGLPRQTEQGFGRTLDRVIAALPDRIAIYGYSHLPGMFKAQRRIRAEELPDAALRLRLLQMAIARLGAVGYVHIGMDHFARPDDELVTASRDHRLQRNFQGYSTRAGLDLIGVGMSSISRVGGAYSQNTRSLIRYGEAIAAGRLATERGLVMTREDQLRATIIEWILCGREVSYDAIAARYGVDVRRHFRTALAQLEAPSRDGLVELHADRLVITPRGRHFLRALAMPFDAYLPSARPDAAAERSAPPAVACADDPRPAR